MIFDLTIMQDPSMPPMPTMPAIMGLACYKCFKQENVRLSRCSGCCRISYCSTAYQADWKVHKPMCKALSAIETSDSIEGATLLHLLLPNEPTTDVKKLYDMVGMQVEHILSSLPRYLKRELALFEILLVSFEPRCMVCTRTDQLIRMEDAAKGMTAQNSRRLIPCPQCNVSFYCSQAHLDIARTLHHGPCDDAPQGHEGLSQCEMHREEDAHTKFEAAHPSSRRFKWSPPRVQDAWTSVAGSSWEGEFDVWMDQSFLVSTPVAPWIRAASDDLSMIMTILYGLEKLNGSDVEWTRKHTLTIHIIGAARPEVDRATHPQGFEEILHRLPQVKTLKLVLCGPNIPGDLAQTIFDCQVCRARRAVVKRIHEFAVDTYHGYVASKGSQFEKPDLCIAFNSGAAQISQETWPATFKILVEREIPTLFTSYTRHEAEGEAALLRASGATLHPELGPAKNPWGSLNVHAGTATVYGFQAESGWLAGGFR
ncbi:hypothetical protein B0H11DRAFT_2035296 [Mycena galericulata]|nr:hypothetical protein B0H11DRAFT_2035296 [Mycena galericulata]